MFTSVFMRWFMTDCSLAIYHGNNAKITWKIDEVIEIEKVNRIRQTDTSSAKVLHQICQIHLRLFTSVHSFIISKQMGKLLSTRKVNVCCRI